MFSFNDAYVDLGGKINENKGRTILRCKIEADPSKIRLADETRQVRVFCEQSPTFLRWLLF